MITNRCTLILQECSLIESTLYSGLTDLKRANLGSNTRYFYSSLFGLSIGLERMMKLILIMDYIVNNEGENPEGNYIRSIGHDLIKLRDKCNELSSNYCFDRSNLVIERNEISDHLYSLLDSFSRVTRYENLNRLTGKKPGIEPLEEWKKLMTLVFAQRFTKQQKNKVLKNAAFQEVISPITLIFIRDLDASPLMNMEYGAMATIYEIAAKYLVWDISKSIVRMRDLLNNMREMAVLKTESGELDFPYFFELFNAISEQKQFSFHKNKWP